MDIYLEWRRNRIVQNFGRETFAATLYFVGNRDGDADVISEKILFLLYEFGDSGSIFGPLLV